MKDKLHRLEQHEMRIIEPLVQNWEETFIKSCMDGYMGQVYTVDKENPLSAHLVVGEFNLLAGEAERALVEHIQATNRDKKYLIAPQHEGWHRLIEEVYGDQARKLTRNAIKKEGDQFDRELLKVYVASLPEGYELVKIEEQQYKEIGEISWAKDLCVNYPTYSDYKKIGLGYVVIHKGKIVAGASSYSSFKGGIEIEIDTQKEHRRKGLAIACGAKLIMDCLERGWYPSWDAATKASVALAEKLGYHFSHEYRAYLIKEYIDYES